MQVSVQETAPGTVELDVLVDQEQYDRALEDVMSQVMRTAQIPGFRKGKAPRAMVERSISQDAVRARVIDKVLPSAYEQAIEQTGVKPLTEPEVKIVAPENTQELRFKMIVHKAPEVELGLIRGVELTQYFTNITDEEVDKEIQHELLMHGELEPSPGSRVEVEDVAILEVVVAKDGELIPGAESVELKVPVGAYVHTPAIDDDLLGMSEGEVKDIVVTYPSNFRTEELRDQETTWHVTLKEIQRRRIPELDEEFARTVGGVDSVEAYRDKVRADLEARFRELDEMTFEAQIMNKLLESSRIVFPDILVQEEVDGRLDRLQRDLQRKRSNLQTYAASKGVTPGEIVKEIHDEAEEDLRRYLLIHQIASQEGILVSPEEVSARIEMDGLSRGARPTIIKIEQTNETKQNETTFVLLKERVMALVRDNAKITEIQSEGTAGPA